jgi:hypothetical protein
VVLPPGEVVVVVNLIRDLPADDPPHPLDHPFPPRIGVEAAELHPGDVAPPNLAVLMHEGRFDLHAVLCAHQGEVPGGDLVAETPGAEMHPDPHEAVLVLE